MAFIERLLNQGDAPLVEQAIRFSAAREKLIADNVSNISTPDYVQKDLSPLRMATPKPAATASWPSERWLVPLIRFWRKRS